MDYRITCGSPADLATPCIITAVFKDSGLSDSAKQLDQAADGHLSSIVDMGDIQGKAGQSLILHRVPGIAADRVLLVGCGKSEELSAASFSKAITTAVSALKSSGADAAVSCLDELEIAHRGSYWKTRFTIEAAEGALYRYSETKSGDQDEDKLQSLSILVAEDYKDAAEKGLQHGRAIALGSNWAKTLGNLPGNICTPTYLAEEVRAMSENYDAMSVEVLEEEEMEELGMGALLSVSRGSVQPAKLIVMQYRGGAEDEKPVVLVGKGLTFDAGGISIKPAAGMDEMKYDMMGGGSVIGTMKACAEMGLPMNVTAVVPSSENLPDGDANKPGDIVTTMSGQTVEVLNTDAEGRLILCDALTYSQRFEPKLIIDVATLTGACIIALGHKATGLMANDQDLADDILKAGRDADDRAWQLPIWDDYQEQLDSNFADIANIGGRPAGSITAACFLSRFTKENRWAHLDIAGTAWNSGGKTKGATGRPVPLLSQILLNQCDKD